MENGMAPRVIAARSAMWNSGRLESISATVSPCATPSPARPPATASTRSRKRAQVKDSASSCVRTAIRSGWVAAVSRKASATVAAAVALLMEATLPDAESAVGESAEVVGQADHEQPDHEREADEAGALHDVERDRPPAHLLRQRPEDVPAVEGQEREQVDDAERERDEGQDLQRERRRDGERLPGALVSADDAGELLALLRDEDLRDVAH